MKLLGTVSAIILCASSTDVDNMNKCLLLLDLDFRGNSLCLLCLFEAHWLSLGKVRLNLVRRETFVFVLMVLVFFSMYASDLLKSNLLGPER